MSVIYVIVLCTSPYCEAIYISCDIKSLVNREATLARARNLSHCAVAPLSTFWKYQNSSFPNSKTCVGAVAQVCDVELGERGGGGGGVNVVRVIGPIVPPPPAPNGPPPPDPTL